MYDMKFQIKFTFFGVRVFPGSWDTDSDLIFKIHVYWGSVDIQNIYVCIVIYLDQHFL